MFRSFFTAIFSGSSAVFCAVTIPPADLRSLSLYYYAIYGRMYVICACLVFLYVGDLLVNSNDTKHSGEPPEDGREKRPKQVGVLYLQTRF